MTRTSTVANIPRPTAAQLAWQRDGVGARLEAAIGYAAGAGHEPSITYRAPTERPDAHEKHA